MSQYNSVIASIQRRPALLSKDSLPIVVFFFSLVMLSSQAYAQRNASPTQDKPTVITLEVFGDPRGALGSQQEWMQALQKVGANRVTTGSGSRAEASVNEQETTQAISIRVKGFLEKGKLVLPGGKFSIRETDKIKSLLAGFRVNGAEVTLAEKKAFGLTAKQLVWLHSQLNVEVKTETNGKPLSEIISTLRKPLEEVSGVKVVLDSMAQKVIRSDKTATEEMKGLSTGTSLAAILRPHGLVLEPVHVKANEIELHIKDSQSSEEHWPVGWPLDRPPIQVEPKMSEQMPIQIKNFPLDKVMVAVQKRADVPFLYDQNSLAREGIEMPDIKVSLTEKNASLSIVVFRLLRQTKPRLSHEMRMDEKGKGFIWISAR
ncbi:MAG: hypothetical protein AAFN77_10285 [Planctomycetota bacterium]